MDDDWRERIDQFGSLTSESAAAYRGLLEATRARWHQTVKVHSWRLDVLSFEPREPTGLQVQGEYRVRDGQPVMHFRLGPAGTLDAAPVVAGDICKLETAPQVLESFLLQLAEPDRHQPEGRQGHS